MSRLPPVSAQTAQNSFVVENVAATSTEHAYVQIKTPTSGGDAYMRFTNGSFEWVVGIDASFANALTFGSGATPGTNTIFYLTTAGRMVFADGSDVQAGTGTGLKIGSTTTQKLGFWNTTPVVQPSTTGEATGFTAGAGTTATHLSTWTGNSGTKAYTTNDIVKHLKAMGLLAAS